MLGTMIKAMLLCGFLVAAQAGILYSSAVGFKLSVQVAADGQTENVAGIGGEGAAGITYR